MSLHRAPRVVRRSSVLALALAAAPLTAAAQNAGWPGPSFAGAETTPTGSKPQSKLWWNDGAWWGCLWSASAQAYTIHRLRVLTQTWVDTGVAVDLRPKSRADCLWDGAHLYVASHQYTGSLGGPGHALELYRYSYDPNEDEYSLDVGFPTWIGDAKTEALVVDEDSAGTLWATWTQGLRVWIAHSVDGDDARWSAPAVHPRCTSDVDADDLAAVVAFGGKLGVLWSNQVKGAFEFTFHEDGAPADEWSPVETAFAGLGIAEDHLSVRAASDGSVYAALGTDSGDVVLAVRDPQGTWTQSPVAARSEHWGRPVLLLDEEQRLVRVFATTPASLGSVHEKSASMDTRVFPGGPGTPVIRDGSGPAFGDATTTKQAVSAATGLVVLASHVAAQRYAHHHDLLGPSPAAPPVAVFHVDEGTGHLPSSVQFLDASTGRPAAWHWDFGDGSSSSARHPRHEYARAGSYTVTLTVTNDLGSDSETRADAVVVRPPPRTLVLRPIADAHAYEGALDANYGGTPNLRVRGGREEDYQTYLQFFVPPTWGQIVGAELSLATIVGSRDGGAVYRVSGDWSEPKLDWATAPALGELLGQIGRATAGTWARLDLGGAIAEGGVHALGMTSTSFHSVIYSSRQGVASPELRLELRPFRSSAPASAFTARRGRGAAPVTVQFLDASSGPVREWLWDFGDGATSRAQNPSHVYERPGRYSVALTVVGAGGEHTLVRDGFVDVAAEPARR